MASSAAPDRRELHLALAPSEEAKRAPSTPTPAPVSVVWYTPGTSSADLRETITNRLALQSNEFVLQEPDSGNVVTLSAGLPSGLTLHVRYFVSTGGMPPSTDSTNSQNRAVPKVAAIATASSTGHSNDLSKPLLDSTAESIPRLSVRISDTKRASAIQTATGVGRVASASQEMQELLRPLETMLPNSACYPYARARDEGQGAAHADGAAHNQRASQSQAGQHEGHGGQGGNGQGGADAFVQPPSSPSAQELARDVDSMLKLNRIASFLANERTFLAWIRTACSMFSLAISIVSLSAAEALTWRWLALATGFVVAVLAVISYGHGVERYFRIKRVLLMRDPPAWYGRRSVQPFAALTACVWGAVLLSYIVRGLLMQQIVSVD